MASLTLKGGLLPGLDPDDFCWRELCEMARQYHYKSIVSITAHSIVNSYCIYIESSLSPGLDPDAFSGKFCEMTRKYEHTLYLSLL